MSLKILMCCHLPLDPKLGGAKVYIENAKAYEGHGHQVTLLGLDEYGERLSHLTLEERIQKLPVLLKNFLNSEAGKYDVVEYEYLYFPFPKPQSASGTKFVARSVLLEHHLLDFQLPSTEKNPLKRILKNIKQRYLLKRRIAQANYCLENSDFINVPNFKDKDRLKLANFDPGKIIVSPYGIFSPTQILQEKPLKNSIAYIASFDPRKGCLDLPKIIKSLKVIPNLKIKLLGVKGRYQSEDEIIRFFPKDLHPHIEVVMSFEGYELDGLLKDVGIGIFPSYLESFGFGIIELTSRGIPVIAYDVPGPSDIIPCEYLSARGDWKNLAKKVLDLQDESNYSKARADCFKRSQNYIWNLTVLPALEIYRRKREQI